MGTHLANPQPAGPRAVARIDEAACIGCTLCLPACPVDAIVGAAKLMHAVLAERCTGCELCLPPCPVDCIALLPAGRDWTPADARLAEARARERAARLQRQADPRALPLAGPVPTADNDAHAQRQAAVAAAFARARARRSARARSGPRS
jgi:H+/Na+-translocating ferredoxin:NAD+ oxidoreductase subunit B